MTLALKTFMKETLSDGNIQSFQNQDMELYNNIQEVHSKIKRWIKLKEVFRPLSLVRVLLKKSE